MFASKKRAAAASQPDGTADDDGAPPVKRDGGVGNNGGGAPPAANLGQFDAGSASDTNAGSDAPMADAVPKDISAPRDDVHDDLT
ncbi:hypothetical protein THAOC_36953, partial [Thalassiosira oceanica]